jgi:hypothetical protein
MEKKLPILLQEVIFGSSDSNISKQISKLNKSGKIRKIAPKLYTPNKYDTAEEIIRRNLFSILGHLYPGAVLSHRSAFEFEPTSTGQLFLTYKYTRKAELPGLTLRLLEGNGPIGGDNPLAGDLYASQRARAYLENLQTSRKPGPDSKTLPIAEIKRRLAQIITVNGEEELNKVRDNARMISKKLGLNAEFSKLNNIISALLTTHSAKILESPVAAARAFGIPYDPARLELFEILFRELNQQEFKYREEKNSNIKAFRSFAFYESYFSNYIEGTEFQIEEAKQIIKSQKPLRARKEDSHDILGTYKIVSDPEEMNVIPEKAEDLLELLLRRHRIMLEARSNINPGKFKDINTFAGKTSFVDINLVRGTLLKSFYFYQSLQHPFARAAYMMFVVSEVHPFLDGNGRIARVMMNAELVSSKQAKIIIPTVYRDDYLGALRRLTRQRDSKPFLQMLSRAHEFSSFVTGSDMDEMQILLDRSNAFIEHTEAKLIINPSSPV